MNLWRFEIGEQRLMVGYVKATIHRVYAPPDDQLTYERLGCIYFCNVGVLPPLPFLSLSVSNSG